MTLPIFIFCTAPSNHFPLVPIAPLSNCSRHKGVTRVYLIAGLQISRVLPKFIVDYAAERAMPRATKWLRPEVEALKEEWLVDDLP